MDIIFQIIFAVMGAFLSVVLTKFLIQNGRALVDLGKRLDELGMRLDEGFRRMDERTAKIAELIAQEADKTRELIRTLKG